MFQASHPFAFFDYFRVPYEVRPSQQRSGQAGAPAFMRVLTPVVRPGGTARSLRWVSADDRPAAQSLVGLPGRYRLCDFTFFGHVMPDAAAGVRLNRFTPMAAARWPPSGGTRTATCSCRSIQAR